MEIVVTSISPEQLMAGKVIGNLGVGITQLVIWILVGAVGLWFATNNFEFAAGLKVEPQFVFITIFTLIPAFIMVAALMAMAGATTTDSREAQQWAGMFTLPVVAPYWFLMSLIESPNSPVSVGLSLFPLTAPVALPIRAAVTELPGWQIALGIGLVVVCAAGAIWLAARAFRLGMLRYGQRLAWKEIFGRGAAK
jgi:ABC-2 type transport system permease protein